MIPQWENECISLSVLSVARVQFPTVAGYFKRFFLADNPMPTCPEPVWQKTTQSPLNDTTQPVDIKEEGQSSTMDRQWLKNEMKVSDN